MYARTQIEDVRCDTVLPKSADTRDTCIRPRGVIAIARVVMVARVSQHTLNLRTCTACSTVSSSSRGLALRHRCHPAWASEGTLVGPGKDTHGTPVPNSGEAVGGPINSTAQQTVQKHGKHPCFFGPSPFVFLIACEIRERYIPTSDTRTLCNVTSVFVKSKKEALEQFSRESAPETQSASYHFRW